MWTPKPPRSGDLPSSTRVASAILVRMDDFDVLRDDLDEASAARLREEIPTRCQELLPSGVTIVAQGDDTFLVRGPLTEAEATVLAERIKVQFISRPFAADAKMVTLAASFGVAARQDAQENDDALLTRARDALDHATARGGNRVEVAQREQRNLPVTSNAPSDPGGRVLMPHEGLKPAKTPAPTLTMNMTPVFDADTVEQLQELADDPSFLEDLYESYLASAQQAIAELTTASDADTKRKAAHVLKGSSMNVGARAVATACQELEHSLKMQAESVDVSAWVKVIENELGRVRASWNATFGGPSPAP